MENLGKSSFELPRLAELTSLAGAGLSASSEQQQQQQQQQQQHQKWRRFLNPETKLPMEEIVINLSQEIKTTNEIAPVKR